MVDDVLLFPAAARRLRGFVDELLARFLSRSEVPVLFDRDDAECLHQAVTLLLAERDMLLRQVTDLQRGQTAQLTLARSSAFEASARACERVAACMSSDVARSAYHDAARLIRELGKL